MIEETERKRKTKSERKKERERGGAIDDSLNSKNTVKNRNVATDRVRYVFNIHLLEIFLLCDTSAPTQKL